MRIPKKGLVEQKEGVMAARREKESDEWVSTRPARLAVPHESVQALRRHGLKKPTENIRASHR